MTNRVQLINGVSDHEIMKNVEQPENVENFEKHLIVEKRRVASKTV